MENIEEKVIEDLIIEITNLKNEYQSELDNMEVTHEKERILKEIVGISTNPLVDKLSMDMFGFTVDETDNETDDETVQNDFNQYMKKKILIETKIKQLTQANGILSAHKKIMHYE